MVDNYSLWEDHDNKMESRLANLPVCDCCGERIQQDTAVRIDGFWYCDECLDEMREDTERGEKCGVMKDRNLRRTS